MSEKYQPHIRTIEDFPSEGILFYDISPLLGNAEAFKDLIHDMSEPLRGQIDKVVGFDARGFLFAGAIATELEIGTALLRKAGKLPGEVFEASYDLEYGTNTLAIQADALQPNERVLLVDDVIATGGTALAGIELVRRSGAEVVEFLSVVDLPDLGGSRRIIDAGVAVRAMVSFGGDDGKV
ncbi:MAG: adenine phosphoribosyltransferase [Candidatus Microsaccharimonas sp.]